MNDDGLEYSEFEIARAEREVNRFMATVWPSLPPEQQDLILLIHEALRVATLDEHAQIRAATHADPAPPTLDHLEVLVKAILERHHHDDQPDPRV